MPTATTESPPPLSKNASHGLVRSASLLSLGGAASRVLGLVREIVIAWLFGATGMVSAFRVASQVPVMLYDLLVGGMLSAALVPVLSEYLQNRTREEYERLIGVLFGLFSLLLTLLVVALEVFANQIAFALAAGFARSDPALLALTAQLIRVIAPAVWLLSMAGLLTAVLFSLERFSFPALATAIYNLGIIVAAPLLAGRIGVFSLAVGVVAGAFAQLALMAYELRRRNLSLRLRIDWRHPALRRILTLYAPIALGLIIAIFQIALDRRLASGTGEQSIAWMSNATTLQQMPLGLISVAIALASLPRLSQYFAAGNEDAYRTTLGDGLRLVILLIVPAAVLLWMLGQQVVTVLFERNRFTAQDTDQVVLALNIYLVGMVFAAIDFPLNYAFYARQNTLLPALVGVFSVGAYIVAAFALLSRLGYLGLVWADTVKQAGHALVMLSLLRWRVGSLDARLMRTLAQVAFAAAVMALAIGLAEYAITALAAAGVWTDLLSIVIAGGAGVALYVWVLLRFGVREMSMVVRYVATRTGLIFGQRP